MSNALAPQNSCAPRAVGPTRGAGAGDAGRLAWRGSAQAGLCLWVACIGACGGGSSGGNGASTDPAGPAASVTNDAATVSGVTAGVSALGRRNALAETTVVLNPAPAAAGPDRANPAVAGSAAFPVSVAVDAAGNLYVTQRDKAIRKITPAGLISLLAENDGAMAADAGPDNALTVAADGAGNLQVSDAARCTLRRITPAGRVSTTRLPRLPGGQPCAAMHGAQG